MRVLVLDDDPERRDKFACWFRRHDLTQVLTVDDFTKALAGDRFDAIFLDHDLGMFDAAGVPIRPNGREATGQDAAKAVAQLPADRMPANIVIQSWNPWGAAEIHSILYKAGIRSEQARFGSDRLRSIVCELAGG